MVKKITLEAQTRTEKTRNAKDMIASGFIPAVLYGKGVENRNLMIKSTELNHAYAAAGETHLIDVLVDGKDKAKILIKDVQKDIMKNKIIHVDFYQVNMKTEIEVQVPLHFIGEAKAVKELGGTLVKNIDALDIKCLPGELIDKVDVDISVLNGFDDAIYIKDIKLPEGIEVLNHPEDMLVHVMETVAEVEPEPVAAPEAEKPEEKKEVTEKK